jgi:hypothetical protein
MVAGADQGIYLQAEEKASQQGQRPGKDQDTVET